MNYLAFMCEDCVVFMCEDSQHEIILLALLTQGNDIVVLLE